jgi:hypothetical protein
MALDLETFYMLISPEQDSFGKILINRRSGELRNWYFCSQAFDKGDGLDRAILDIANQAREVALSEAYVDCGYSGEFKLARPKSCNEKAAKKYMSGRIVIVLDNFNIEETVCDIHNGLFCRSIDDDPRIWKKSRWGKKYFPKKNKRYVKKNNAINPLADKMPEELKIVGRK